MPRKSKPEPQAVDVSLPAVRKVPQGDPRDPLPMGATMEMQPPTGEVRRVDGGDASKRLLDRYSRALIAHGGDPIPALAQAFELPESEVAPRMIELHERIVGAAKANQVDADLFERYDVTQHVQIAMLRQHLFAPDAKVSLKAIEMLREMDATSKSKRIGSSFEKFMFTARAKAAGELLTQKKPQRGKSQ